MIATHIQNRVRAGVTWLNEHRPDWRVAIDVDSLNQASAYSFVLGQLAQAIGGDSFMDIVACRGYEDKDGEHTADPCIMNLMSMTEKMTPEEAQSLGFEIVGNDSYAELDEAWTMVLQGEAR